MHEHGWELVMSKLLSILSDPHRRTNSMYHFKVSRIKGNTVSFHDASRLTNTIDLPNDSPQTLEEQYKNRMDNLFIATSITGQYFFYSKLSNERSWPNFYLE